MPKLKRLSGDEVIAILGQFHFTIHTQRGSHVKLSRTSLSGNRQILTVPRHRELDIGTLQAIFRQACRYAPEEQLRPLFYSE